MSRRLLALLAMAWFGGSPGVAASPCVPDDPAAKAPERAPTVEREPGNVDVLRNGALLQRWNRLTPTEQGRLRERFEQYKRFEAPERERLAKRGKRLDLLARQLYRELPDRDRARVDAMPAAKRREIMREMAADKARDVGRRIQEKFPESLRKRLEAARPEDRARFLEEFRTRQRERMGEVLVRLGEELQIDDAVIKRISRLPDDQRGRKFLEFLQRRASVEVGRRGLPPGVTLAQWHAIWELPADEFFEAIMALRQAHPTLALPPGTPPTESGTPGDGAEATDEKEDRSELRRRLVLAARTPPSDRIELSDWQPADRRREILRRRRERVLALLIEEGVLSATQQEAFAELPEAEFLGEVRGLLH